MSLIRKRLGKLNNWLVTGLVVSALVLNDSIISQLAISFLVLGLFIVNFKNFVTLSHIKLILFSFFLISVFTGLLYGAGSIDFIRAALLFQLFWIFPFKFNFSSFQTRFIIFAAVYVILIQIGRGFGWVGVADFVTRNYPIEDDIWTQESLSGIQSVLQEFNSRFGGRFYNPNVMGQIICLIYAVTLHPLDKAFSRRLQAITIGLFFISILLSGSRTAMVPFLLINFFYLRNGLLKFIAKNPLILFLSVVGTVPIFIWAFGFFENFRVFNLAGGFNSQGGSVYIKAEILFDYIHQVLFVSSDYIVFLFGKLHYSLPFDSDFGYVLSYFGLLTGLVIVIFFVKAFVGTQKKYKSIFFVFLISIGATVLINFRFSILLFIILSQYHLINEPRKKDSLDRASSY